MELCYICLSILCFVLIVVAYLYRTGVFYKVKVRTDKPTFDTICWAYTFYKGSYREVHLAFKKINSIVKLTPNIKTLGIYYDDPAVVENGKQRYAIGVVINDDQLNIDSKLEDLLVQNNYKLVWITKIDHAVITEFPCKTALAIFWSVMTVYPKLKQFIKKQKLCAYPFIEYYHKRSIEYVVPLCEQEKFFVPEYYENDQNDDYYKQPKNIENKTGTNTVNKKKSTTNSQPIDDSNQIFVKKRSTRSSTAKKRI